MSVININNISGIASVNAQSGSLELFTNGGASLLDLNVNLATFPGDISVGGDVIVGGGLTVTGVLTYDDVTNIDSIGVITARTGIRVTQGGAIVGGALTASNGIRVSAASSVGIATDSPACSVDASRATDAFALPQGTTTQRPTGDNPFLRYNTTNSALEFYNGTSWVEIITDYFPTGSVILG